MSKNKKVNLCVYENSTNGHSLVIEDRDTGHRLAGAKLGSNATLLKCFVVDVKELRSQITAYQHEDVLHK